MTPIIIFLSLVLPAVVFVLVLEVKLGKAIGFIDNQLQTTERQVGEYRSFTKYLRRKDRVVFDENLSSVLKSLNFLRTYRVFLERRQRVLIEQYHTRTKELMAFLEKFIPEYTKREVERHQDFFGSRSFDGQQLEAIVKLDSHNLVIAPAGSGKTRTLTARLAYLIRCGVNPDEILALAYTTTARDEMLARLRNEYGIPNANVRTLHSFGLELARHHSKFRPGVADKKKQRSFIRASLRRLLTEKRTFAMDLLRFAIESRTRKSEQASDSDPEKEYEYLRSQKHTTLNGKQVKSIAERDIANFLFLNRVKFEYETQASWADKNREYRQYQPDFYLPEYGLWIEHWAIDRNGDVPRRFLAGQTGYPTVRYRRGMEWKKGQFKKHGRKLIETYHYQWAEGILEDELKARLKENRVEMQELTMHEVLKIIREQIPHEDPVHELMFSFIRKAKTNGLQISHIDHRLKTGNWDREQRAFASLMIEIWKEYESLLSQNDMIDFSDMINYALEFVKQQKGEFPRKYLHILIDEFQDITDPQLELVKCLLRDDVNNTLFCVGDDDQNIFSFAGSNIHNILHFEKSFPYAEKTILSTNYRGPKNIVEASNHIARLNNSRIEKSVVPASKIEEPLALIEMPNNTSLKSYDEWEFQTAKDLLEHLLEGKKREEQIMVLARFNQPLKRLMLEFPNHEALRLRFLTIHRAKGTEADLVLLLGCVSGMYGFPSEVMDQRLLEIVKKDRRDDPDKLEEERRLFYVALTRCKNKLFLFTSRMKRSKFVSEIEHYLPTQ